jgi:hypothetical protein
MEQLKRNNKIEHAEITLTGLSANMLTSVIRENRDLKNVEITSEQAATNEEITALCISLRSVQLKQLVVWNCNFENDERFLQMLDGCSTVSRLKLKCGNHLQCNAVVRFVQDDRNVLSKLDVTFDIDNPNLDVKQAVSDIITSLRGNQRIVYLYITGLPKSNYWTDIDKILCDSSSLNAIRNLNHSIEYIDAHLGRQLAVGSFAEKCLELNRLYYEQEQGYSREGNELLLRGKLRYVSVFIRTYGSVCLT